MKLPISKLVNNTGQIDGVPANPRTINKDDYAKLLKSLQEDPDYLNHEKPHVIKHDEKYVVLNGNQRLRALRELKYKETPVEIYDEKLKETPEVLRARIIKSNHGYGDDDMDLLANEAWSDDPLGDWGVDLPEDWLEQEPEIEEDEAPEVSDEPPVSKLGEVYQLGRHRVGCMDSTVKENVEKLMNGEKADVAITDPPYGINIVQNNSVGGEKLAKVTKYSPIENDDGVEVAHKAIEIMKETTENQIIFGGNYFADKLEPKMCWVVWDKDNTGNFADCELAWTSYDKAAKLYKVTWNGMIREGESGQRVHPTQKPIKLFGYIIKDFDPQTVQDLFLGSGSTLIACEQTDRTCYGMELDPKYVDVIRKRYHKFVTGSEEGWEDATKSITK